MPMKANMAIPQVNLTIASNGRLVIPANMRAAIGLRRSFFDGFKFAK